MEENAFVQEKGENAGETPASAGRRIPRWVFIADAALVIAAVVAIVFSSFWSALGERFELSDGVEAAEGKIANFTVGASYGYFAERYSTVTGEANGRYLLCDYGGEPLTVIVPSSEFSNAAQIMTETLFELLGQHLGSDTVISGEGYVRPLTESELNLAYDWFEQNKGIFDNSNVDASDAASIIGTHVVVMDYIGSISAKTSTLLVNLALALFALALALPVASLLPVKKSELEAAALNGEAESDTAETDGEAMSGANDTGIGEKTDD